MEECFSVNKQICATKARHFLKQFLPNKPHKWSFKLFVMRVISVFAYNFEIFCGSNNEDRQERNKT
jgi:hypothetical protein